MTLIHLSQVNRPPVTEILEIELRDCAAFNQRETRSRRPGERTKSAL